jgi:hypothetical protein
MSRRFLSLCGAVALTAMLSSPVLAQGLATWTPDKPGSDNIDVLAHIPLGPARNVSDIEIEQEMERPYAYVGRMVYGGWGEKGTDIIDLSDPSKPEIIHRWRIENQDLHLGLGGMDVKYFKWDGRYYVVQSVQFGQGGPNSDMGAVVLDVTDLPESYTEVARLHAPDFPGGFHNIFMYKHSNGRPLLFATVGGPWAHVYDMAHVVEGAMDDALVAKVPVGDAESSQRRSYHDMYAGWHEDTQTDRFYGGGTGGYYVFDVTDLENPSLIVSLTGIAGVDWGHTFTPSPDGRYVIAEAEYQYAPLRIFDLQPALDGETKNIRQPISAWTADWRNLVHNHEVRWPYVFVSGYLDGLQVFSMQDPKNPVTVAYYDTYLGGPAKVLCEMCDGLFGVDVRNADGLIVGSDMTTGFWVFRMAGFSGWTGAQWGLPERSSAQDWDMTPGAQQ